MPVTDVTNDAEALTMTLTAEFDAPLSRVWQLYADPRQLEKCGTRRAIRSPSSTTTCPWEASSAPS
jgi:hypothetical protein